MFLACIAVLLCFVKSDPLSCDISGLRNQWVPPLTVDQAQDYVNTCEKPYSPYIRRLGLPRETETNVQFKLEKLTTIIETVTNENSLTKEGVLTLAMEQCAKDKFTCAICQHGECARYHCKNSNRYQYCVMQTFVYDDIAYDIVLHGINQKYQPRIQFYRINGAEVDDYHIRISSGNPIEGEISLDEGWNTLYADKIEVGRGNVHGYNTIIKTESEKKHKIEVKRLTDFKSTYIGVNWYGFNPVYHPEETIYCEQHNRVKPMDKLIELPGACPCHKERVGEE